MSGNRWERWAPVSGIAYLVLFIVAFSVPGGDIVGDSDEQILAYYADSGNRSKEIAAFFLVVAAALCFLWFVGTLRNRLRLAEAEPKSLSALAFGSGVVSAGLLVVAAAIATAVSVTVWDTDRFVVDPNVARLLGDAGYMVLVGSMMVAAVFVAATSLVLLRTAVLPKWLGWIGLVVALALLVSVFFFPIFVFWAWVLVVSVVLLVRPPETRRAQEGMVVSHQ